MTNDLNRREFLVSLGVGATAMALHTFVAGAASASAATKPIVGSWFEFQHHATVEGVDWNPALVRFTAAQWDTKIKEIAEAGLEYLVLMATAQYYRSFYTTQIYPKWELACPDPLEAVLSAADKYKVKFFIGAGFYGDWTSDKVITEPVATTRASTAGTGRTRRRSIRITRRIFSPTSTASPSWRGSSSRRRPS
jgi:hypothetical protein